MIIKSTSNKFKWLKNNFPRIIMILMWGVPVAWLLWRHDSGKIIVGVLALIFLCAVLLTLLVFLITYSFCVIKYNSFNPEKHTKSHN